MEPVRLNDEDLARLQEHDIQLAITQVNAYYEPRAYERTLRAGRALYAELAEKYEVPLGRSFTFNLSNGSILLDKSKYEPLYKEKDDPGGVWQS